MNEIKCLLFSDPPIVSANATNTTVKETSAILKCIAEGNPDSNYKYGKWIQRWPGFAVPVSERPGSETLVLTNLTYEHSGAYTCTASNGIKIFNTNEEFVEGTSIYLLVKCKFFCQQMPFCLLVIHVHILK